MPTDPNRRGSAASMMQYTYLPRLALAEALTAGVILPPRRVFSVARRSAPRPLREAAVRDRWACRVAALAARLAAIFFGDGGGPAGPRGRSVFRALAVGFRIF